MKADNKKKGKPISEFAEGFILGNWATAIAYILIRTVMSFIDN